MIKEQIKEAILTLHQQGIKIREISRVLKVSRNTVKKVLQGKRQKGSEKASRHEELKPVIEELFKSCGGNVVRVREILGDSHDYAIHYSTLTRIVRDLELRGAKRRSGEYDFPMGCEMQHDTSPHNVIMDGKKVKAQCAALVLAYSRRLFVQYYPCFTRFEARVFLTDAFLFMDGVCPRCTIDNSSVIVAHGSGPSAEIAPEMERFGHIFGVRFVPHALGDADRKARVERNFSFLEGNFLAGRTFKDWQDINRQVRNWCMEVANPKVKRSIGMSPEAAYVIEKPHLTALPLYIPPVYHTLYRVADVAGYVRVDTNRYSVPERLVGKEVEVHKLWDRVRVFFKNQKVADHPRLIDKKETRITSKGHHPPFNRHLARQGPCEEEKALLEQDPSLDQYVLEIKKRSCGRAIRQMRRLLALKRTYPATAFIKAIREAFHYGLYDLGRLEHLILSFVAGDFFRIEEEDES